MQDIKGFLKDYRSGQKFASESQTRFVKRLSFDLSSGADVHMREAVNYYGGSFISFAVTDASDDFVAYAKVNPEGDSGDTMRLSKNFSHSFPFPVDGMALEFPAQPGKKIEISFYLLSHASANAGKIEMEGTVNVKHGIDSTLVKEGAYTIPDGMEAIIKPLSPILSINEVNVTGAYSASLLDITLGSNVTELLFDNNLAGIRYKVSYRLFLSNYARAGFIDSDNTLLANGESFSKVSQLAAITSGTTSLMNTFFTSSKKCELYISTNGGTGYGSLVAMAEPENFLSEFRAKAGDEIDGEKYVVELY